MLTDEERKFRIRPRKPPAGGRQASSGAFHLLNAELRRLSNARKRTQRHLTRSAQPTHRQRCAVRIRYSKNTRPGQWKAHGRYIARDSALGGSTAFDDESDDLKIGATLDSWQKNGDERLWKLILSPEFGDRVDLKKLAKDLMARMESDFGARLEWVAAVHRNTDHPHVHVALRGIDHTGRPLRLSREYVKAGIRNIAEELCTRQLGYRTPEDARLATQREVTQTRFTSLDRQILQAAKENAWRVDLGGVMGFRAECISKRLTVLSTMGLALADGRGSWKIQSDFEQVLRAAQATMDRQKTLEAHGVTISDDRLPLSCGDLWTRIEGRVLMHGEDDTTGSAYMLIEGVDGCLHHVHHTPEIENARVRGALKINAFVRMIRISEHGGKRLVVDDLGDAHALLSNPRHFRHTALELSGEVFDNAGRNTACLGWLGRCWTEAEKARLQESGAGSSHGPVSPIERSR